MANVADTDGGSGSEALALRLGSADSATGADRLQYEWGTSWGAVEISIYTVDVSLAQSAAESAQVVMLVRPHG